MNWRVPALALVIFTLGAPARAEEPASATAPVVAPGLAPLHTGSFLWLPKGNRAIAATLSLGLNGLGQLYNDEPEKGYGMMSGWLVFPLGYGLDALTGRAYGRVFTYALEVGIKTWSTIDAFNDAAAYPPPPPPPPPPSPSPAAPSASPAHP